MLNRYLEYSVKCDERARAPNPGAAMDDNRPLFRTHTFSECAHKPAVVIVNLVIVVIVVIVDIVIIQYSPDKSLWWLWHTKVWPGCEVEVPDSAHSVPAHHAELVYIPIREMRLVQDGHLAMHDINKVLKKVIIIDPTCISP